MHNGSSAIRRGAGSIGTMSSVHVERLIGIYVERMPSFHVRSEDAAQCIEHPEGVEGDTERVLLPVAERLQRFVLPGPGPRGALSASAPPRRSPCKPRTPRSPTHSRRRT